MTWMAEVEEILAELPGEVSITVEALGGGTAPDLEWAHRPEVVYPAASLIKLPILLTALEAAARGGFSLEQVVEVGGEATGGAGVVEHFRPGTRLTVGDLLFCMIAVSDNAATNHVLDLLGMDQVNVFAGQMGLRRTVLRRKMMDSGARAAGRENLTTPEDLHCLLRELVEPRRLSPETARQALALLTRQQFKLGWATFLPEERLAHKTGDLEGIFHDAGILDPAGPVPVVYTYFSAGQAEIGESSVAAGRIGRIVAERLRAAG